MGSGASRPKEAVPHFETIADALSGEDKEKFGRLSEQVSDIMESHGGRIVDAELTSAERLLLEEHDALRSAAMKSIRMAQ